MVAVILEKKIAIVVKVRYRVVARSSSSTTLAGRTGEDYHLNIGPELMSSDYLSLRKYRVLRLSLHIFL